MAPVEKSVFRVKFFGKFVGAAKVEASSAEEAKQLVLDLLQFQEPSVDNGALLEQFVTDIDEGSTFAEPKLD